MISGRLECCLHAALSVIVKASKSTHLITRALFGYPMSCSVLTSLFCIIFALSFSRLLSTHSSRYFIESLLCLYVVAKRCPLLLIILGNLLGRSNGKKCGEDGLLGHITGREDFEQLLMTFWAAFIVVQANNDLVSSGHRSSITHHNSPRFRFLHVRPSRHRDPRLLQFIFLQYC